MYALSEVDPICTRTHTEVAIGIALRACGIYFASIVDGEASVRLTISVVIERELVLLYIVLEGAEELVGGYARVGVVIVVEVVGSPRYVASVVAKGSFRDEEQLIG